MIIYSDLAKAAVLFEGVFNKYNTNNNNNNAFEVEVRAVEGAAAIDSNCSLYQRSNREK